MYTVRFFLLVKTVASTFLLANSFPAKTFGKLAFHQQVLTFVGPYKLSKNYR